MVRHRKIRVLISVGGILLLWGMAQAAGPFSAIQKNQDPKHTPIIQAPETFKAGEPFKVSIQIGKPFVVEYR